VFVLHIGGCFHAGELPDRVEEGCVHERTA
jgi:hypothetical protein